MTVLSYVVPPALIALVLVAVAIAAAAGVAAYRERTVHAPDKPGLTAALLIRQDDTLRTAEGTLLVDRAGLSGDGKVLVGATDPTTGARYEYAWPITHRVDVIARVASPLVGK